MTSSFLVALDLAGRRCLVVGRGDETSRRVRRLLDEGADVRAVTGGPELGGLAELAEEPRVEIEPRPYRSEDLDDVWLAVLCDRDPELAARIGADARARRVFFCALDQPGSNSFSHVAVARSGALQVAISTAGRAPLVASKLRAELERILAAAGAGRFVERVGRLRDATASERRAEVLGRRVRGLRLDGRLVVPDDGSDD